MLKGWTAQKESAKEIRQGLRGKPEVCGFWTQKNVHAYNVHFKLLSGLLKCFMSFYVFSISESFQVFMQAL